MFSECQCKPKIFKFAKEIKATNILTRIFAFQPPKKCIFHFLRITL